MTKNSSSLICQCSVNMFKVRNRYGGNTAFFRFISFAFMATFNKRQINNRQHFISYNTSWNEMRALRDQEWREWEVCVLWTAVQPVWSASRMRKCRSLVSDRLVSQAKLGTRSVRVCLQRWAAPFPSGPGQAPLEWQVHDPPQNSSVAHFKGGE